MILSCEALNCSKHDSLLNKWVRNVNKTPGQNTTEKTPHSNLLKEIHWIIYIRPSALISKAVKVWLSVNESQYISTVKKQKNKQKQKHVYCSLSRCPRTWYLAFHMILDCTQKCYLWTPSSNRPVWVKQYFMHSQCVIHSNKANNGTLCMKITLCRTKKQNKTKQNKKQNKTKQNKTKQKNKNKNKNKNKTK